MAYTDNVRAADKCLADTDEHDRATFLHQAVLCTALHAAWTQMRGAAQDLFDDDYKTCFGMMVLRPARGRRTIIPKQVV